MEVEKRGMNVDCMLSTWGDFQDLYMTTYIHLGHYIFAV